jgi:hypothetical protein
MKPLATQVTKPLVDPVVEAMVPDAFLEVEAANASGSNKRQPGPSAAAKPRKSSGGACPPRILGTVAE